MDGSIEESGKISKEAWDKLGKQEVSAVASNVGLCAKDDCHIRCHDCGQLLKKHLWVPKNHSWKKHALCLDCLSSYDDPNEL
jgi:hypothetical protein